MMEIFKLLETGPLATIQDGGRFGFQQFGVPVSGALDRFSLRVANLLVGNPEAAAVIETTFTGLKLEALAEADVALAGAHMPVEVNGEKKTRWTSFQVKAGDIVAVKPAVSGLRGYLAVTGGFDVPVVMNSRSTYLGGKIGGFHGRTLAAGDVLHRLLGSPSGKIRTIPDGMIPEIQGQLTLRAVPGPQDDFFDHGMKIFFSSEFKVSAKADRMGYRLEGNGIPIKDGMPRSIISEPSLPGAVQIPADGQPIILLVEQTVGGYAKIATVVSADLHLVAQARPGDSIRFQEIDLPGARRASADFRRRIEEIRNILARTCR